MQINKLNIESLNLKQKEAVLSTDGPLLIIAGPGSGKTKTLVDRVLYLIMEKGVKPENILVSTFTEKAAKELLTRLSNKALEHGIPINFNEMYLGTLHSICLRILEDNREFTRLRRNYTTMEQFDQQYFLYQRIRNYQNIENSELIIGKPDSSSWYQADSLLKWINKISEEAIDYQKLIISDNLSVKALGECYKLYQEQLEKENALDFSTIQYETLKILNTNHDILKKLNEKIHYIMVDEYQDTNTVQESILFKLTGSKSNICVVGDDDQGLYRFRGATIRNILEFPDRFPEGKCKQINLSINYRSHPNIVNFYNQFMQTCEWNFNNKSFRFEKNIVPQNKEFPEYSSVVKVSGEDKEGWNQEILDFLKDLKNSNVLSDWNQVAFLFSSVRNDKVVALSKFLEENEISVYSPRSNMFFDRDETLLMIGALITLFPQFDQVRRANVNNDLDIWEYHDKCLTYFFNEVRKHENKELLNWIRNKAIIHKALSKSTDYSFSGLFYELLQFPLFNKYFEDDTLGNVIDSRPTRNLSLISKLLTKFEYIYRVTVFTPANLDKCLKAFFNQFLRFLKDGGLNEFEDDSEYAPSGCISFLTIHQSKGLEFPVVCVGSLDNVPRKQHTDLDILLQERYYSKPPFEPFEQTKKYDFWRLYYTAFSRAQNILVLTAADDLGTVQRKRKGVSEYFLSIYNSISSWKEPSFDLKKIELEQIKSVNIKHEYSFTSHIAVFENCSLQYKFFKDLNFSPVRQNAALFGSLVHQTIEDVHRTVLRGEEHKVTPEQIESWFNINYFNLTAKERVYLSEYAQKSAMEHVLRYSERHSNDWSRVKEAEVDVSLVKDKYILKGSIDLIRGDDQTVEIIDFKSEKKIDLNNDKDREKRDRYRKQLEVYAHLVEERTGQKVSKMHLYYTGEESGNPYVTFPKSKDSINQTIKTFDEIVNLIESRDYSLKERPTKLCKNCDMKSYCDYKELK
jgi:DNA helicase-2/ATP-dependent DNA helicase PcrA